jgi:hypothetical protein
MSAIQVSSQFGSFRVALLGMTVRRNAQAKEHS